MTLERLEGQGRQMTMDWKKRLRDGNPKDRNIKEKMADRKYLKEATVIVNVEDADEARAVDIIKAVAEKIGEGKILALRPRQGKEYELTLEKEETCDILMEGLMIKGSTCEVKKLQNRNYVVSFMHLPVYLEDSKILDKLIGWGVEPVSKIKRRVYPGTDIEDGTRFVKACFPKEVVSLPYSTRLETEEGLQYFRVMHSHQVKTCRLCMSPEHMVKDCPDFKCHKCEERGHFARDCTAEKCLECREYPNKCECGMEEEEGGEESQVDGQMHEGNNEEDGEKEKSQQQETDKGSNKESEGEKEQHNEEQRQGRDLAETLMEVTASCNEMEKEEQEEEEQDKEMDSQAEKRREVEDRMERQTRRRTLKVIPNIDNAKKRMVKKGREKCLNHYEVLRGLSEEN
ncbi:hypothetical protein M9458_057663 [Cirrhinus mrigala]|uniref:CCHC-type domain-containing protein n=1 Tax=Cirrhinus mrigala TaxID=683832 RepID=A0ABD0MBZ5_CIRMR